MVAKQNKPLSGDSFPSVVARAFRKEVERRKWTVKDACEEMGWSLTTYYRINNGESADAAGTRMEEMLERFGLTLMEFLGQGAENAGTKQESWRENSGRKRHNSRSDRDPRR